MQRAFFYILLLLTVSCFFVVNAAELTDSSILQKMDRDLHINPKKTYQSLLKQAEQVDNMSSQYKLWWLLRKAQAENSLYFFERSEKTVEQAFATISQDTPAQIIINIDILRGLFLQRKGSYLRSQHIFDKAQKLAIADGFKYLAVFAKQEKAYTRSLTGVYELSLTELQHVYIEAVALGDDFLIARANEIYGAVYGYMNDYAQSVEYHKKALAGYENLVYPYYEAEAIYGLAVAYRYWEKYDFAIEYYHRYREKIEFSPNNINGHFFANYGIAMSEASSGICGKALISIDAAIKMKGPNDYKAELYKRKASCLIAGNKLDEAKTALDKADNIFKDIPDLLDTHWQIEVLKIRSRLNQAQGNYKVAYQLLSQFNQKEVSLLKNNMSERLLSVRGALEAERQNAKISLLEQRTKVQELRFEQQQQSNTIQTYIIGFVVLLIIAMLFFTYFQWLHNRKLKQLSIRDPLSNSFNRRFIFNFLHKLVDANKENKISIMVVDVDDFKKVNDIYGHPLGDQVICKIAEIGSEVLRKEDVIGRVGGEEFLCVLPRIGVEQSLQIAQRFVDAVSNHCFIIEADKTFNVTVSIGIATTSIQTKTSDDLYLKADKALYYAKNNGKNCAIQYQDSMQYLSHNKDRHKITTFDDA